MHWCDATECAPTSVMKLRRFALDMVFDDEEKILADATARAAAAAAAKVVPVPSPAQR
jgi:hypothetical protein